jgi:glycerophosphoryl diester phosphodiesterase
VKRGEGNCDELNCMAAQIIAHRGASHEAPENTLAAIRLGWEQQADAVEVDVHQSRDGHMVVIHDATTRKTARLNRRVDAQTLAQLRALEVGRWKHRRWEGEPIPTLAEVLATVPTGKRLFVEIKCSVACLPQFVATIRNSPTPARQIVPIGFNLTTMRLIKWALPESEVCWVVAFHRALRGWRPRAEWLIEKAREAGLDGLDVGARGPVDARFVQKIHAAGLKLYIWTVDSPKKARQLNLAGVDGITTNRPGWLRGQIF